MITSPRPLLARQPPGPLAGAIRVPGDKSISHRALMIQTDTILREELELLKRMLQE